MEELIKLDHQLFFAIHKGWHNRVFDVIMPMLREKWVWIPLYGFATFFILGNFKKDGWKIVLFAILLVTLSDQISSSVIKPLVARYRPCKDPAIEQQVTELVKCGSGFSFPSSHAANHFAIAIFMGMLFLRKARFLLPVLLVWALLVSTAQVYVGVHFPLDIIGGALLGTGIGFLCYLGCRRVLSPDFDRAVLSEERTGRRKKKKKRSKDDTDEEVDEVE